MPIDTPTTRFALPPGHVQGLARRRERFVTWNLYAAVVISFLAVLAVDAVTPLGTAVWILYIVPVTLSLGLWTPAAPLLVAIAATIAMVATFFTDDAGIPYEIARLNRTLGLLTIWCLAIVGYFFIRNKNAVRTQEWLEAGHIRLNDLVAGEQRLDELVGNVLRFLADYLDAHVGAIFVRDGNVFRGVASYGTSLDAMPAVFRHGEGLPGQAAADKRAFLIKDVPEDYLTVRSGLGERTPERLLVAPCAVDGKVNAVIELGFMHRFDSGVLALVDRVAEAIGIAVRSANYRVNLQGLLEETQRQAEELQAQSEELRVSNEELEEQSRAMQEAQTRLEQQQAELEQTNAQLEEQTQLLETQRDNLARAQADLQLRTRELEQASQYKSDFLANMSHELRTPLNSLLILAKLLADNEDGNLSDEQVRYAETIRGAGNDLLVLINDILDLSKIEAGHMEMQPESVRLAKLADDAARTFEPFAQQKNIGFSVAIGPGCPEIIETDGQRLEQILKNLLSNAIKFTETGEVKLTISRAADERIAFAVSDTGIGITTDQQQIIFQAFRQADGTTNRRYGGTGLGLSVSRELARLLGGDIQLASEPGRGSVFTVTVPQIYDPDLVAGSAGMAAIAPNGERRTSRAAATRALPEESQLFPAPRFEDDRDRLTAGKRIILAVEDDEPFARILYDMAHELDFQCLIATSVDEAMQISARYLPHAVILDVGLPDHSGLSVLDRLKQDPRTRHIPVHVISASDYTQTAYSLGAVGYMLKPVKKEQLADALRQLEHRLVQRVRRVLVVEDDAVQRESLQKLLGSPEVEIATVGTVAECLKRLREETFDCMVLDLSLPDASGYSLLETLSREDAYSFPPVIVYTGRDLSSDEEQRLRRYSKSIIIKGAKSPERLLDEVTLFLHQVVAELPAEQQRMLKKARNRDSILEGRRILVVEDDIRNVYSLTNILEPRGAVVRIARNGREALAILEKAQHDAGERIDLVLMDVMMPEMDGLIATREIRKHAAWKKLPIIMLTAKAMQDDQERCIEAGANDYLAKPLDVDKLLSLVRVWMPR
jgi:signal transduction histidine kinase/DNA-binding response OmpR family regulator